MMVRAVAHRGDESSVESRQFAGRRSDSLAMRVEDSRESVGGRVAPQGQ